MGGYISIGLVYDKLDLEQVKNELQKLIIYLDPEADSGKDMKVCRDINGEEWIEYNLFKSYPISDLSDLLTKYYYGQLTLKCNVLGFDELEITIHIEKEEDYFGFLLDVSEAQLIKTSDLEELNNITEKIICFVIDLYKVLAFDYAFCDNEAEIQYSPIEFRELKNDVYSIVVLPKLVDKEKSYDIIKSNWHIDGLTMRK